MSGAFAQQKTLDIPGIHLLVHQSITENKLQVKARDQQAAASANEQANLTLLARLKATYRTLQRRYNTLGTVINLADIGIYATPVVERIISNQKSIITLAEKNPALIATGYRSEIQFAEKAKSLAGYVAGLVVSIGDINQMKASDRKMLFDYVLSELNSIAELSANMVNLLQYSNAASLLKAANPFQDFIDADKAVASQIIQNAKYLK
jgi:exopolysaccharide biosynthesis predicted pyruvyltransferase EpsI